MTPRLRPGHTSPRVCALLLAAAVLLAGCADVALDAEYDSGEPSMEEQVAFVEGGVPYARPEHVRLLGIRTEEERTRALRAYEAMLKQVKSKAGLLITTEREPVRDEDHQTVYCYGSVSTLSGRPRRFRITWGTLSTSRRWMTLGTEYATTAYRAYFYASDQMRTCRLTTFALEEGPEARAVVLATGAVGGWVRTYDAEQIPVEVIYTPPYGGHRVSARLTLLPYRVGGGEAVAKAEANVAFDR